MIRGLISNGADEVRIKFLHQPHGSPALRGTWTTADHWLVKNLLSGKNLYLGVESDIDTKRRIKSEMRMDARVMAIPGRIFQSAVYEVIDFDCPVAALAQGPGFGVYWTMASGFSSTFEANVKNMANTSSHGFSVSNYLHEQCVLGGDGPDVIMYRNFFDDETCLRLLPSTWESAAERFRESQKIAMLEVGDISFDGQTYDYSSQSVISKSK